MEEQFSVSFGHVDAVRPEHALADNDLATGTNIDPSATRVGGVLPRRGSYRKYTAGSGNVLKIHRYYGTALGADSRFFVLGDGGAAVYSGAGGAFSKINNGALVGDKCGMTNYKDQTYLALTPYNESVAVDTAGNTTPWLLTKPSVAPVPSVVGLPPLTVCSDFTVVEGTDGGNGTGTTDSSTYRLEFQSTPTTTDLSINSGNVIGDYGVHSLSLWINDPSKVFKISQDYSIGDEDFTNYWHAEMDVVLGMEVLADPEKLVDGLLESDIGTAVDADTREQMISVVREGLRFPVARIAGAKESTTVWALQRPMFQLIGTSTAPSGWTDIRKTRLIIEARDVIECRVSNWVVQGAENYSLNDPSVGYAYWETYIRKNSDGFIVDESAPGPVSGRVKVQQGQVVCTLDGVAPPPYTDRILYAQGGYMRQPYAVATVGAATTIATHSISDIKAISQGKVLDSGIRPWMYNTVRVCSKPYKDRIFVGYDNRIAWTKPGKPNVFPTASTTTVSYAGDVVMSIIPWAARLIIVNRDSVYEMYGNVFEGSSQDWVLQKTGAKRGSQAWGFVTETPYGISLIDYDGIFLYQPGQGSDIEIPWAAEQMRDAWGGKASTDPAVMKGNRIPGINLSYIYNSSACYADGKLYCAIPTGSDSIPTTIFVLDFNAQKVYWYSYPFPIYSLFWDRVDNSILAGSSNGAIMEIESGIQDHTTAGVATPVVWSFKTKKWSTPSDIVLENLSVDLEGTGIVCRAYLDNSPTPTDLGTATKANRDWYIVPFNGVVHNNLQLEFSGSHSGGVQGVYGVGWEGLIEPKRRTYYKSPYFTNDYHGEKLWRTSQSKIEITQVGTVTKTMFIDGVAVSTATMTGVTPGQNIFYHTYPPETYGDVAYNVYSGVEFKLWDEQYLADNEPMPVDVWKGTVTSLDENIVDAFDTDVNPNGTVTASVYVDNNLVAVTTFTGAQRQSYTYKLPVEQYGRTVYAKYTGNQFKVYNDWFHLRPQPDRWTNYVSNKRPLPSDCNMKTWLVTLDCLGGSVVGTCVANGVAIATATFSGPANQPKTFREALDLTDSYAIETASEVYGIYNSVGDGKFKFFNDNFEVERKPFGKKQWSFSYKKIGGATELDLARYWSLNAESPVTCTITSVWDVDGTSTNTQTITISGHEYEARKAFPPGVRGRLFQQRMYSNTNFQVYSTTLDTIRVGAKGTSKVSIQGIPGEEVAIV